MMDTAKAAGFKRANHSDKGDVKAYHHANGSKLFIGPISWEHTRGDYHSGGGYGAKSLNNYIKGGMKYRTDDSEASHHDKKYGEHMMFNDSTGREASEGGPGSGRHKSGATAIDRHMRSLKSGWRRQKDGTWISNSGTVITHHMAKALTRNAREADGNEPNYVKPRYPNIKPEGDIDPRDVVKTGQQGGGHSGGGEKESRRSAIEAFGARRPATMEGKRGWTERQRAMHSKMGKQIAGSN